MANLTKNIINRGATGTQSRFSIQITDGQIRELESVLRNVPNGVNRAIPPAINRTLNTGRTRIVRRIGGVLNLKQAKIREAFTVTTAGKSGRSGKLNIRNRQIDMMEFKPRQDAKGISVRVRKDKGIEKIPHWFINNAKSDGKPWVLARVRDGDRLVGRYAIFKKYGPSVLGAFENAPSLASTELAAMQEVLDKNIASQVDRLLSRKKSSR